MKNPHILSIVLFTFTIAHAHSTHAQYVQLTYAGSNEKIIAAVNETNKLLALEEFYRRIDNIPTFNNTTYSGRQITQEMRAITTIEVTEYYKRRTRTNAKTMTRIRLNSAKLDRSLADIAKTLVHETIHAVDWLTNKKWDYTHRTQYEEIPPVSAPYVIGAIAEQMLNGN